MSRALLAFSFLAASVVRADMGPRFCNPTLTAARALLDADVVLQVEVLEFTSKSTPTQVGSTYLWSAKVKISSVLFGDYAQKEATFTEECSGGSSGADWIPPCSEPMPRDKGGKTTLFLKKNGAGFTFLRTRVQQHHASDCPAKTVVDEVKKKRGAAWAKIVPGK